MDRLARTIALGICLAGMSPAIAQTPQDLAAIAVVGRSGTTGACGEDCCSAGGKVCRFTVTTEKVMSSCFDVECQPVCIPPVTFPWQTSPCDRAKCGGAATGPMHRFGRIRYVNVLMEREYEAGERCVCDWKVGNACTSLPDAPAPRDEENPEPGNDREEMPPPDLVRRPAWFRWPWR